MVDGLRVRKLHKRTEDIDNCDSDYALSQVFRFGNLNLTSFSV